MAEQPHPVDVHVGTRVRMCRTLKGLSQQKLAASLGLTFQQVQKYERGANRISASRLWELGQILDVPVSPFCEDADAAGVKDQRFGAAVAEKAVEFEPESLFRREILELVRAYDRLENPAVRKRIFELIKTLGEDEG